MAEGVTRSGAADLVKGLAALLMIQVHLMELFAQQVIYDSVPGRLSLFFGGPPVAPVYMCFLGYFVAASHRTVSKMLLRAAGLLTFALMLNLGMNVSLFRHIESGRFALSPWPYVFGVDILGLAALAIAMLTLLRTIFKTQAWAYLAAAALVAAATPAVNEWIAESSVSPYLLACAGGEFHWSYFPLFPWLSYPLLGFAFYQLRGPLVERFSRGYGFWMMLLLLAIVIGISFDFGLRVASRLPAYYHHGFLFFGWTALFLGLWIGGLALLYRLIHHTACARYVTWLGRNVTAVYVIQWLMIGNLGTMLYKTQGMSQLLFWYALIAAAVGGVVYLIEAARSRLRREYASVRW